MVPVPMPTAAPDPPLSDRSSGDPQDGTSPPHNGGRIILRRLETTSDLDACVALQKLVWGEDFGDLTSPALLKIVHEVAGVSAGAFDRETGRLEGFVYGISGLREGRPAHWSHMLAVRPGVRGEGLGVRLKAFQRRLLLAEGIETVFWTYDPLVARNAYLNLERLGARPVEYRRDYYGSGEDSALSSGLGTDRFVVRWDLAAARTERALTGDLPGDTEVRRRAEEAPIVNVGGPPTAPTPTDPEPDGWSTEAPLIRVEIPADVQAVRDRDAARAATWRSSTRKAIETALARGYRVDGLLRWADGRCQYLFVRRDP